MKRNIILLTALSAALFGVVSCSGDKGGADAGETTSGTAMSAEEIKAFSDGFKTKYGETSDAVKTKLDTLFASTKKATVTGKATSSQTAGDQSRTGSITLTGEYDFDDNYAHFKEVSENKAGTQTRNSMEEVFFVKEGAKLAEYSENGGNKVASSIDKTIHLATYDRLVGFTRNYISEALFNLINYPTMDASKELKMTKEAKGYFAEFKNVEKNEEEKIDGTTTYKFRYNEDYLPIYIYENILITAGEGDTKQTSSQTTEYKIEAKDSITKTTFDKTTYESHIEA